jgi:hypothetical protein
MLKTTAKGEGSKRIWFSPAKSAFLLFVGVLIVTVIIQDLILYENDSAFYHVFCSCSFFSFFMHFFLSIIRLIHHDDNLI